jgi:hypothetical protein
MENLATYLHKKHINTDRKITEPSSKSFINTSVFSDYRNSMKASPHFNLTQARTSPIMRSKRRVIDSRVLDYEEKQTQSHPKSTAAGSNLI